MYKRAWITVSLALFFLTPAAEADERNDLPEFIALHFSDAALAELSKSNKGSVTVIASRPKTETRTRTVAVQKMRKEVRIRSVDINGKPTQQPYEIQVPYVEQIEQTYTVTVPGQQVSEPVDVALAKVKAWDVNGNPVSAENLRKKLSDPTATLLLQRPWPEGAIIEPSHYALLREDVLLLYSQELRPAAKRIRAVPLARPAAFQAR